MIHSSSTPTVLLDPKYGGAVASAVFLISYSNNEIPFILLLLLKLLFTSGLTVALLNF